MFFVMNEIHEGKSLKEFIKDRGTIQDVLDSSGVARHKLNWLIKKDVLTSSEKKQAMSWINSVWPQVDETEVFRFRSTGNYIISGSGNIQGSHNSKISGSFELENKILLEKVSSLEEQVKYLKEVISSKEQLIEIMMKKNT